jgi:hypothetical protein
VSVQRLMRRVMVVLSLLVLAGCGPKPVHHLTPLPSPSPAASSALPAPSPSPAAVPVYLLNPDVTPATIRQTICVAGWTATVRPPSSYTTALKRRQLPVGADLTGYEEDHQIPLELGGAPRNPVGDDGLPEVGGNLWAEPIGDARRKDKLENQLHTAVCAGRLPLDAARQQMYDWPHPLGGAP